MANEDQPNVIFLIADDQRFDTIGALHETDVQTPNLDRLVDEGVAFSHHHNMGSCQGAVCVPARAMIHSGRSLFNLEGPGKMTTAHPTLPEAFGTAGYQTFGTGKWHNGEEAFNRSFEHGRNIFFGGMGNHWNVPVTDRYPLEEYPPARPHRFVSGDHHGPRTIDQVYERFSEGTHSSEFFADAVIDFLHDVHRSTDDRPFFAYAAFMAPHDPRTAPGGVHSLYDPADIDLPDTILPEHPFDNGALDIRDEHLSTVPRDPEEVRRHIADYYAMITHLDAQIGRILDAVDRTGETDNTIVVFTADHGLAVGQHGLLGKQNLYDHSTRVPLLMRGPGLPAGTRAEALSTHVDIYPTLAALAGVDGPDRLEGTNLAEVLAADRANTRESVFTAYGDTQRALRTREHKLIEYLVDGERTTQVFDLESDPSESNDLTEGESDPTVLADLRTRLTEAQQQYNDPASWPTEDRGNSPKIE